ncbi:MAG: TolC family protein [Pseudomonadota bacterium]
MLPGLVASAEYTDRNNDPGSRSVNLQTGTVSAAATRSTEQQEFDGDLTLTWDILDFGISYNRSQQRADDVLIALEQRRAATNRVIEDTRSAYWRAVSAQRLLNRVQELKAQGTRSLRRSQGLVASEDADPREQLEFQRDLLENQQTLEQLSRDLSVAKRQLAALMNLPIGADFHVEMPKRGRHRSHLEMNRDDMILNAMVNRPELREITYRQRKNDQEVPISTLEAVPGLQVFVGTNFSDNDLLQNDDWVTTGARVSWNLMRLARLSERRRNIGAGGELLDARALALTQAVATQVMVSRSRY